jgi:hypothetical protein
MTQALEQRTYLPEPEDGDRFAEVISFLHARERRFGDRVEPRYLLVGADQGDRVPLPTEVHAILKQVVSALQAGRAVTVCSAHHETHHPASGRSVGGDRPTVKLLISVGSCRRRRSAPGTGWCCVMSSTTSSGAARNSTKRWRPRPCLSSTRTIPRWSPSS